MIPRKYRCPSCDNEVAISPTVLARHVADDPGSLSTEALADESRAALAITRPIPHCAVCPGEPEMERHYS
jgi:hypothetical protein